ncbi:hypothetical protein GLAREA_07284 [Glarea lozoyensis ATCC 20868]|uniref:DUF4470 domain-containing protein n=1 Tax=Glarea lozoyensis (strain ATCC 20868 / MF5171) TaxID=1116229 RepID=S3DJD3_GLAL2|nr:uncharacterized protein GLAREA_07284 [Glarea lozoyensis ATCC 20868]EPE32151.1 hypothetical protein GLAREA_07284 [Glarea lozoyensis ATCC 20868]
MLGTTALNLRYFFYPIGNTPAVNVVQDRFRPANGATYDAPVKVLFLAYGDPRNLLFSLWYERNTDEQTKWEFTCCDIDAAVLARNIILISLIIDEVSFTSTWNIFYHLYIPDADIDLLHAQAEKLLLQSDSINRWMSSVYGKAISFLDQDTLNRLRALWTKYAATAALNIDARKQFEVTTRGKIKKMFDRSQENSMHVQGLRSVGPNWTGAVETISYCFSRFWETGVVAGNLPDLQELSSSQGGRVNPMFAISSSSTEEFAVHYGSEPLLGFHLATAFDGELSSKLEHAEIVVQVAKSQFRDWCTALQTQVKLGAIEISIFWGDALRFCYELQANGDPARNSITTARAYRSPWLSNRLCINRLKPYVAYDVIDTSNLIDHVGILNTLPAVAPLLSRKSTSVLFTDSLLKVAEDPAAALPALLCSDVTMISLLLGLAPAGHLVGYTTDALGTEAATRLAFPGVPGRQSQYYLRIAWKIPSFGERLEEMASEPLEWEIRSSPEELSMYFFNSIWLFSPLAVDLRHYNRLSFVLLLYMAKHRIQTDWPGLITSLLDKIGSDRRLLVGSNSVQEFYVLLHLSGLFCTGILKRPPREIGMTPYGRPRPPSADPDLLGRSDVPSIIFVALNVPRKSLKCSLIKIETLLAHQDFISVVTNMEQGFDNSFFAIQCFFGKLLPVVNDDSVCNVLPDDRGWGGIADLVVTCAVPSWSLLLGSRSTLEVALTVTIFAFGVDDDKVRLLREPPGVRLLSHNELESLRSARFESQEPFWIHFDKSHKPQTMKMRVYPQASKGDKKLSISQVSPCTLNVKHQGSDDVQLTYPYPVDGKEKKAKITSEGYIEVTVLIATAPSGGGYDHNPFPVCIRGTQTAPMSIPHINMNIQPIIHALDKANWIPQFLGWTLSGRERKLREQKSLDRFSDGMLQLKSSINAIFPSFIGLRSELWSSAAVSAHMQA